MNIKKVLPLIMIAALSVSMLVGWGTKDNNSDQATDIVEEQENLDAVDDTEQDVNSEENTGDTVAKSLLGIFYSEIESTDDIEQVAAALIESESLSQISIGYQPVEEGFLSGFDEEISGFNKGVCFMPNISTIPFVGYIFETDNPDELAAALMDHANLNWNICTEADEMVVETNGNYVFFVMSPYTFD